MNSTTASPIPSLRLLVLFGAVAAISGCSTPAGGEVEVVKRQPPMESKTEAGSPEADGGVDILSYRPPGSDAQERMRPRSQQPPPPPQ